MFSSFCMRKTKAQTALLDCKPSRCFGCSPHVKTNDQIWLKISQFWLTSVADHDRFDLARLQVIMTCFLYKGQIVLLN